MVLAAYVEWTPLIELLAVIAIALSGVVYALWSVACGARRCAEEATESVARADEQNIGMKASIDGLRTDMKDGFARLHERLDKFKVPGGV